MFDFIHYYIYKAKVKYNIMTSITDHLIKLQELTQKNLDILQALNDSFFTNQNHLSVSIGEQQYAIPSFISLENKLNSLTSNFENLVNAPETGEAFFDFNGNSKSIQVRSYTTTPNKLILNPISEFGVETNNIFKDFLTPNPYIHLDVQSLPNDTTEVMVKKIIPINTELVNLFKSELSEEGDDESTKKISVRYNYKDLYKLLTIYKRDVDYIEYDTKRDLPIRKNIGESTYVIEEIIEDTVDENLDNFLTIKFRSDINDPNYMNSLKYRLFDETIEKMLKVGDQLITYEGHAKLLITEIRPLTNTVVVKVLHGEFLNLIPSVTNEHNNISSLSKLKFYSPIDFDNDKYINVSLEEDQYIFVSVAAINSRMNVQSSWGGGLMIDTFSLKYGDKDFKTYYKENVKNVGDILSEMTSMMKNPLTKYTPTEYEEFTQFIPDITKNMFVEVVQINNHLNNSTTVQNIRSLYSQKIELQTQLSEIQDQINEINEVLSTISFDDTSGRRTAYIQNLSSLNIKKSELNTSILKIVDEISMTVNNSEIPIENAKYRIRGYFNISDLPQKDHIKGIRVQYRYKNIDNAQNLKNSALTINGGDFVFSEWNEMECSDRDVVSAYNGEYKSELSPIYEKENEPSFNQIDIPISQGETVDIKLKLIYDYGFPFTQTSSAWSDIVNIEFPKEFLKDVKILDIISENNNDIETNRFNNIIREQGVPEHIGDKLVDQDITYYHKPENIASGFYTQERRIIPLKDKLTELNNAIIQLKSELTVNNTDKLTVSIKSGGKNIRLNTFANNNIYLDSYNSISKNDNPNYTINSNGLATTVLNLSLANDSDHVIKLYSIFPGNRDVAINAFKSVSSSELANYTAGDKDNMVNATGQIKPLGVWIDIPSDSIQDIIEDVEDDFEQTVPAKRSSTQTPVTPGTGTEMGGNGNKTDTDLSGGMDEQPDVNYDPNVGVGGGSTDDGVVDNTNDNTNAGNDTDNNSGSAGSGGDTGDNIGGGSNENLTDGEYTKQYKHIVTELDNDNIIAAQTLQTGGQYLYFRVNDIYTHKKYYNFYEHKVDDDTNNPNNISNIVDANNQLTGYYQGIKWSRFFNIFNNFRNEGGVYDPVVVKYFGEEAIDNIDLSDAKLQNKLMFVYPKLTNRYGLHVGLNEQELILYPNDEIIIPIVVEFFVSDKNKEDGYDPTSISKTLSFDIRPSLYKDPLNYKFTIISKRENTIQDDINMNQETYNNQNSKYNIIYK